MIRLHGLVLPLVKRVGSREWHMVDYPVVHLETWNTADMNEISNGNVYSRDQQL